MVNAYNAVRMAEVWSLFQAAQTSANEGSWSNWNWGGDIEDHRHRDPDFDRKSTILFFLATSPVRHPRRACRRHDRLPAPGHDRSPDVPGLRARHRGPALRRLVRHRHDRRQRNQMDVRRRRALAASLGLGRVAVCGSRMSMQAIRASSTGSRVKVYGQGDILGDAAARAATPTMTPTSSWRLAALAGQGGSHHACRQRRYRLDRRRLAATGNFTLNLGSEP